MPDALIWGASGGMGHALTTQLLDEGWRVFAAVRDTSKLPTGLYQDYEFNAADFATIQNIAAQLAYETEGFDLWVYAAGELRADLLKKMTPTAWSEVMDSNLNGAFAALNQTVHLINQGGHVAFIGAYIDHLLFPKMGAYAAAKAGLETLIPILQKEHRKLNFTLVKPGAVATSFWDNAPFRMPKDAKSPDIVAQALLTHTKEGKKGILAL